MRLECNILIVKYIISSLIRSPFITLDHLFLTHVFRSELKRVYLIQGQLFKSVFNLFTVNTSALALKKLVAKD